MCTKEDVAAAIFLFGLLCVLLYECFYLGNEYGTRIQRNLAIEANVAEWVINPKTGEESFRYGIIDNSLPNEKGMEDVPTAK